MEKITNTQYLKVGSQTNVGVVKSIEDNAWFTTTDGFSHNVNDEHILLSEETLPVARVNNGNVFGTNNWYTFFCPNRKCGTQLSNSGDCPLCKQKIDWTELTLTN